MIHRFRHGTRIVHGYDVQAVERRNVGFLSRACHAAPYQVVVRFVLHLPVAERQQHRVILQSLRLMDGQDADAVNLARRDGLRVQLLVPETDESRQLRRVVLHVFRHRIIEGTEICILLLDKLHVEQHEQLL